MDESKSAYNRTLAKWRSDHVGREARWATARSAALKCHACSRVVSTGEPYRKVTKHDWPFCQSCAKARFEEDPPSELAQRPVTAMAFRPKLAFTKLVDVRARQSGEREPGEDD